MAKAPTMADLMASSDEHVVEQNTMIKGKVLSVKKNEILLDLGSYGIGQVPRREIGFGKSFAVGDEVVASVVEPEIPNGNVLLSLRKAAKERGWDEVQKIVDEGRTITVTPYDANRGGLLIELEGVRGFMPVSQLSTALSPDE